MCVCRAGECQCEDNFSGDDCSEDLRVAPAVLPPPRDVCDTRQFPCLQVTIYGSGFVPSPDLVCYVQPLEVSFLCKIYHRSYGCCVLWDLSQDQCLVYMYYMVLSLIFCCTVKLLMHGGVLTIPVVSLINRCLLLYQPLRTIRINAGFDRNVIEDNRVVEFLACV